MRAFTNVLLVLLVFYSGYGQTDFIVSEANTLGGMYIDSDTLYVVSSADRAHGKYILGEEGNDYTTYNLALLGPGFYGYRDICKVDNFLYVTKFGNASNGTPGIYRLDLSDENAFFQLFMGLTGAYGLAARQQELYVNAANNLYKIDLSQPSPELSLVSSSIFEYTFGAGTLALKVYNNYLYVVDDNGISRIDLDDENYTSEYISTYEGWGIAVKDENTLYLTFNDDLNEWGAIYELKIDTQEYTKLYTIDGFLQTYDIEYYDNSLFVTTLSGDNNIVVNLDLNSLSIDETFRPEFSVYPNPTSSYLNISSLETLEQVTIFDQNGRVVKEIYSPKEQIDVSMLADGLYILKINESFTRFVKN